MNEISYFVAKICPKFELIEKFRNPLTEGERSIIDFFDSNLSDDWEIYVQPFLNGDRPDVVILNPKIGLMIIEVKDWRLKSYFFENNILYAKTNQGNHPIRNPFTQVKHYHDNLLGLIPVLNFRYISKGIYFHNELGKNVKHFFKSQSVLGNEILLGKDELSVNKFETAFYNRNEEQPISSEILEMIRTWLQPPYHFKEQCSHIQLTSRQKDHAEPNEGHHRIKGVIGSGKTLVIAYRAAALAEKGHKVLIVTFNKTLWHYIRDMVQRAPFDFRPDLIVYKHFHGFCKDCLNNLEAPKPTKKYLDYIVPCVENGLEMAKQRGKNINDLKFDAILIDEGQDFKFEWYETLCKFLKERNELVIMCDKAQNIYERELSWIYSEMKGFSGRWGELIQNLRLPYIVAKEANKFAKMFLPDVDLYAESGQAQLTEPILRWIHCKNLNEAMNQAEAAFDYLVKEKEQQPTDIVMLFTKIEIGEEMVRRFKKRNIEVNDVFSDTHKKSFWMGDSRTKMSTIQSFKGWELKNIILVINARKKSVKLSSLIYTAIGRTQQNLIVINVSKDYANYGKFWPETESFLIN